MEKELPVHYDAHFLFYAKGHYERFTVDGTVLGDLKRLQADYCGITEEHITKSDVVEKLITTVERFIKPINLMNFLSDIEPSKAWVIWPEPFKNIKDVEENYDYHTAVIGKCLSLLRFITVVKDGKPTINLGKPNPDILPVKEKTNEI